MIQTARNYRNFLVHLMVAISVAAVVLVSILFYQYTHTQRLAYLDQAKQDATRLARVTAETVQMQLLTVDQILRRAVERQHFNVLFGGNLKSDMDNNLKLWANEAPHVEALILTDERGIVTMSYQKAGVWIDAKVGEPFFAMEHFNHQKKIQSDRLLISPYKAFDSSTHDEIVVSRWLERIDGRFGGLIVAVINGQYMTEFFRSTEAGQHTKLALMLETGELLVDDGQVQAYLPELKAWLPNVADGDDDQNPVTLAEQHTAEDYTLFAFTKLRNMPITIALAIPGESVFQYWVADRMRYALLFGIFLAFVATVVLFLLMIARQMRQVQRSEARALVASQAKTDFLARMSHELRTPLNAIIGFSDMLSTGCFGMVNKYQKERLSDINMCGNHLLEFVNDILDFAKGEAGKMTLKEHNTEIGLLITKAMRVVSQKAELQGVKLINAAEHDTTQLYVDGRKIRQIILNLLTNAIKFTPRGGRIRIATHVENNGNFVLSVSDTGVGMALEDIPRALEVFGQLHKTNSHDEGSGLGLPLCKMLAELHQGRLVIKSKENVGTRVSVILPKKRVLIMEEKKQTVSATNS